MLKRKHKHERTKNGAGERRRRKKAKLIGNELHDGIRPACYCCSGGEFSLADAKHREHVAAGNSSLFVVVVVDRKRRRRANSI